MPIDSISLISELKDNFEVEIRRGAIQLLVFTTLIDKDLGMHGKGICDEIEEKTNGIVNIPIGTIYPLLSRFVSNQLIETYKPDDDKRKTYYKLNSMGKAFYYLILDIWQRYSVAVSNVLHYKN